MKRGPDQSEQALERMDKGHSPYEPLPDGLRRFGRLRLIVAALAVLVVGTVVVQHRGSGLSVSGSCTHPGFAFSASSVRVYDTVRWAAAGPSGDQVIITVDSNSADSGRVAGPVTLRGCKASGRFAAALPKGDHVLRVFLREKDGTRVLGRRPLLLS